MELAVRAYRYAMLVFIVSEAACLRGAAQEEQKKCAEQPVLVSIPNKSILGGRLGKAGFGPLMAVTNIGLCLADKRLDPLEVAIKVELALHDYASLADHDASAANWHVAQSMCKRQHELFDVILRGNHAAIEVLKAHQWYYATSCEHRCSWKKRAWKKRAWRQK